VGGRERPRGGRPPRPPVRAEGAVGVTRRGDLRGELVGAGGAQRPQQVLEVVAVVGEVLRQGVEQGRVRGRVGGAQVVHRLDQAAAEEGAPVAVDDVAGEVRGGPVPGPGRRARAPGRRRGSCPAGPPSGGRRRTRGGPPLRVAGSVRARAGATLTDWAPPYWPLSLLSLRRTRLKKAARPW